jgi:hypothetical protein
MSIAWIKKVNLEKKKIGSIPILKKNPELSCSTGKPHFYEKKKDPVILDRNIRRVLALP